MQTIDNGLMASVMTETEYAAELAGARLRLAALKERAAKRARLRGEIVPQPADKDALAGQHPNGGLGERQSAAQAPADAKPAGAALQRLIAAMLLDAATAVPMDSAKLHREASRPPPGCNFLPKPLTLDGGATQSYHMTLLLKHQAAAFDAHRLSTQLSKAPWAVQYEAAQKGDGSGGTVEAALRDMGNGDDASLEVSQPSRNVTSHVGDIARRMVLPYTSWLGLTRCPALAKLKRRLPGVAVAA